MTPPFALVAGALQTSTEVFFRKAKFWDGKGKNAPPVFQADGVQYLHNKVGSARWNWPPATRPVGRLAACLAAAALQAALACRPTAARGQHRGSPDWQL